MKFCINEITFGEVDFPTAVEACARGGLGAMELWLPHVETFLEAGHSPAEARERLDDRGLRATGACFVAGLLAAEGEAKAAAFDAAKRRFELAQELGADTVVCVGEGPDEPSDADYAHAAERLGEVADLAASFELTVALEFIAASPFLGTLASAARLVAQADHAHLGVLFDVYHFCAGHSKMSGFEGLAGAPIAFVHLADLPPGPRERLAQAPRLLPGQGALPLPQLLAHVQAAGYQGYFSVELFNEELWAQDPTAVARRTREACERLAAACAQAPQGAAWPPDA
ncbi:MAG: sugar phosphate isomerase/epimerase family protein [Candidatus Brocadiia bacterium]